MEIGKSLKHISPEWGLVSVCFLWGSSFILIATALESISPGLLVTSRFILGALLTALIMGKELKNITRVDWMGGLWAGTCIFFGYFLQTVGLQTIPSSISAFLTALYVPFVPLLQLILFRKVPELTVGLGIAVAFGGMLLILDPTKLSFSGSFGEWLTIASALACALEIIVIGKFATQCNPKAFCLTQLTVVAAWSTAYTIAFEDVYVSWNHCFQSNRYQLGPKNSLPDKGSPHLHVRTCVCRDYRLARWRENRTDGSLRRRPSGSQCHYQLLAA